MQKTEFIFKTRDRFREKYNMHISRKNLTNLIDCMMDVAMFALKRDAELYFRGFFRIYVLKAKMRPLYDYKTKQREMKMYKNSVRAKFLSRFSKAVNEDNK